MNRRLEELEARSSETGTEVGEERDEMEKKMERQSHNIHNTSNGEDDSLIILPPLRLHDIQPRGESEGEEIMETISVLSQQSHNVERSKGMEVNGKKSGDDEEEMEEDEWVPAGVDGDDEKTTMDTLRNLLDAFTNKNAPLLGFHVTKDLCRRLTTIYDKGLAGGESMFSQITSLDWVITNNRHQLKTIFFLIQIFAKYHASGLLIYYKEKEKRLPLLKGDKLGIRFISTGGRQ